jgi:hypothetical protein
LTIGDRVGGGRLTPERWVAHPQSRNYSMKRVIDFLPVVLLVVLATACTAVTSDKVGTSPTNIPVTPVEATIDYKEVSVSENERGIATDSTGKAQLLEPGTHRLPLNTGSVALYSIADQTYTMQGADSIETRSSDGQLLNVEATMVYHVSPDKVADLAKTFKPDQYVDSLVRPIMRNIVWTVTTQFKYNDVMNSQRAEAEKEMGKQIAEQLRPFGIEVVKFSVLNIIHPQ